MWQGALMPVTKHGRSIGMRPQQSIACPLKLVYTVKLVLSVPIPTSICLNTNFNTKKTLNPK